MLVMVCSPFADVVVHIFPLWVGERRHCWGSRKPGRVSGECDDIAWSQADVIVLDMLNVAVLVYFSALERSIVELFLLKRCVSSR